MPLCEQRDNSLTARCGQTRRIVLSQPNSRHPRLPAGKRLLYTILRKGGRAKPRRHNLWRKHPFCHYCGKQLRLDEATEDHKRPRSKGGANNLDNIVLACKPCNLAKGDLDYEEFKASFFLVQRSAKILLTNAQPSLRH